MMKTLKKFVIAKLLGLFLVGTAVGQIVLENKPTWDWTQAPTQERIVRFANAIARTEGFFVKGTLPNRLHNPGDIRSQLRHAYPGQVGLNKSGYVVFKSDRYGWQALYAQIHKVIDGTSTKYDQSMTFAEIAKVYATSPQWPKTLCKILRISPALTFQEFFGLAPRVNVTGVIHELPVWSYGAPQMPVLQPMPELWAYLY